MSHSTYHSPLASRYASDYMLRLFSDDSRYQTWRRLWTALARAHYGGAGGGAGGSHHRH